MSSTEELWSDVRPQMARELLMTAVSVFSENGFHGTTTRDIASRVGLSPAGLYVYFPSKEDLLLQISRHAHNSVLDAVLDAANPIRTPPDQLYWAVRTFVSWHARNAEAARVSQYELYALSSERLPIIRHLRRRVTDEFLGIVTSGVENGSFVVRDAKSATRAILSMGIDVARWFRPEGTHSPEELGELYAEYSLGLVGTQDPRELPGAPAHHPAAEDRQAEDAGDAERRLHVSAGD